MTLSAGPARPLIVADDAAILHKTRHKPSQSAHNTVLARDRNIFESPFVNMYFELRKIISKMMILEICHLPCFGWRAASMMRKMKQKKQKII